MATDAPRPTSADSGEEPGGGPALAASPGPHPFFLDGPAGPLFAVYHPPAGGTHPREVVLYVPPFAEEMNRSRRMATLLAQTLADQGRGTLSIDLWGTGDSGGDFADARWETWEGDIAAAMDWLRRAGAPAVSLLGLRLGAMLAAAVAAKRDADVARLVLWQPVTAGKAFLNAFLRIRLAAGLTGGTGETTATLREAFAAGRAVEVAGYEISAALAAALDAAEIARTPPPSTLPVTWLEVVAEADRPMPPGNRRVADRWIDAGVDVRVETVVGEPFWSYLETTIAPALIEATRALFAAPAEQAMNAPRELSVLSD